MTTDGEMLAIDEIFERGLDLAVATITNHQIKEHS
jgi:hypothetical protein